LLQLAKDAQKAILADQAEQLLKISEEQTSLAQLLKESEETRTLLIEQIASSLQLPKDKLTLSQLIPSVAEPYATNYTRFRNELRPLISEIDFLNSQNARFIKEATELSLQQIQTI
jgi:putative NADH-flavin reductase